MQESERSELLLYKIDIMREAHQYEDVLAQLERSEKHILDKLLLVEYRGVLRELQRAGGGVAVCSALEHV